MADEIGRRRLAIVDSSEVGEADSIGRLASQADDVDGVTRLAAEVELRPGQIVQVEVTGADDFDLTARVIREVRPTPVVGSGSASAESSARNGRRLPVAPLGLDTVWGR